MDLEAGNTEHPVQLVPVEVAVAEAGASDVPRVVSVGVQRRNRRDEVVHPRLVLDVGDQQTAVGQPIGEAADQARGVEPDAVGAEQARGPPRATTRSYVSPVSRASMPPQNTRARP